MNPIDKIDIEVQQLLEDRKISPCESSWQKLESKLDFETSKKSYKSKLMIAASFIVIGLTLLSYLFLSTPKATSFKPMLVKEIVSPTKDSNNVKISSNQSKQNTIKKNPIKTERISENQLVQHIKKSHSKQNDLKVITKSENLNSVNHENKTEHNIDVLNSKTEVAEINKEEIIEPTTIIPDTIEINDKNNIKIVEVDNFVDANQLLNTIELEIFEESFESSTQKVSKTYKTVKTAFLNRNKN